MSGASLSTDTAAAASAADAELQQWVLNLRTDDLDLLNQSVDWLCAHPQESVPRLLDALVRADEEIRKNAAWVLGMLRPPEALKPLFMVMSSDSSVDVRLGAAWALRQFNLQDLARLVFTKLEPPRDLADIQAYLVSKSWKARWYCCVYLNAQPVPEMTEALMQRARDSEEDVLVRCGSMLTLVGYSDPAIHELLRELVHDLNDQVKITAIAMLGLKNQRDAIPDLLRQLQAYNDNVRVAVVSALGALGNTRVAPHLAKALKDPVPLVRINAAMALYDIAQRLRKPHRNIADMCFKALKDENIYVVKNVVRTLGIVGDEDALREIISQLKDETRPAITANLVQALGLFRDPRALKTLSRLLRHPQPEVRFEVVGALLQIRGQRKAIYKLLLQALKDPALMVKEHAVRALGSFGEPKAMAHLEKMKLQHPYGVINKSIGKALDQLLGI